MQKRIFSIDFARGVVMMIMALDHVRDLLHVASTSASPTDLSVTTPVLFFTRWITYLCAPTFVFLAGSSVFLAKEKTGSLKSGRNFLFKRGVFLIIMEFTAVNFGMFMDAGFHLLLFEVIAAIGFGFIVLSLLMGLKARTILIIGLVILLAHDAIVYIPMKPGSLAMTLFTPFLSPSAIPFSSRVFVMGYPPVPWLGMLLLGYGTGPMFKMIAQDRSSWFLRLAALGVLLFVTIRLINIYGDPAPWAKNKNAVFTLLSFMNVTKYPPSLLFTLITLAFMFLFLWIGERADQRWARVPNTYGQAPLFYFIVHFYLIHIILLVILFMQGFSWAQLDFAGGTFGRPKGRPAGLPLWAVYIVWPVLVAFLYKPCMWFIHFRRTRSWLWLKYV